MIRQTEVRANVEPDETGIIIYLTTDPTRLPHVADLNSYFFAFLLCLSSRQNTNRASTWFLTSIGIGTGVLPYTPIRFVAEINVGGNGELEAFVPIYK